MLNNRITFRNVEHQNKRVIALYAIRFNKVKPALLTLNPQIVGLDHPALPHHL